MARAAAPLSSSPRGPIPEAVRPGPEITGSLTPWLGSGSSLPPRCGHPAGRNTDQRLRHDPRLLEPAGPARILGGARAATDKGVTWSDDEIVVNRLLVDELTDPDDGHDVRTGDILPDWAVDRSTNPNTRGNVYVVWMDQRFNDPDHDDILLARSTDGGLTWGAPVVADHTPRGVDAFTAMVDVRLHRARRGVLLRLPRRPPRRRRTLDRPLGHALPRRRPDVREREQTDHHLVRHAHRARRPRLADESRLTTTSFDMRTAPDALGYFVGDYTDWTTSAPPSTPRGWEPTPATSPTGPTSSTAPQADAARGRRDPASRRPRKPASRSLEPDREPADANAPKQRASGAALAPAFALIASVSVMCCETPALDETEPRPPRRARTCWLLLSTDAGISVRTQLTPARDMDASVSKVELRRAKWTIRASTRRGRADARFPRAEAGVRARAAGARAGRPTQRSASGRSRGSFREQGRSSVRLGPNPFLISGGSLGMDRRGTLGPTFSP